MNKQEENSSAPSPLPDNVPTSSLADVIQRNTEVMQNLCIVLTMLMEMLDPDGLEADDVQASPRGEYLSSKPGKIYRKG